MRILVDTSVWIEFFRSRSGLSQDLLDFLSLTLEDDRVVTIYPIQAEILSGSLLPHKEKEIREAFESMTHIDLSWNEKNTWDRLVEMAQVARKASLRIPGIVDRMILGAAEKEGVSLWTHDAALAELAKKLDVHLFP